MFSQRSRLFSILVAALLIFSLIFPSVPQIAFAATSKTFDFIEVTDFHGYLQNDGKASDGTLYKQQIAAVMAKQIKDIKAQNPDRTVILSGGDMFQGTPLSNVLRGKPVIEMMKNIGFDAMALGNHEYDWGIESVIDTQNATLKNSTIPVLAANVYDKTTGKPVSYVKPYVVIERDGVKIGIIGIVDNKEFPTIIMPAFIQNVDFKDPVPIVNDLAQQLRQQGVKIVVVLAHMGAYQDSSGNVSGNLIDFAKQVKGVDAIFGGHTHTIVTTRVNGIPVGVAANYGKGIIDLKITINEDGTITAGDMQYIDLTKIYSTPNIDPKYIDPEVQAIVDKANEDVGPIFNEVIGKAAIDLTRTQSAKPYGDSLLGNWAAEVTRKAVNADFGFANNGGLRIDIPKGDITVGMMYQLMPFDNTIVTMKMTGAQIKTILEQAVQDGGKGIQVAGLSFKYDPTRPSMHRVFDMRKSDGTPIDMNKSYLVATNNFMGTGGDGFTGFTDPEVKKSYVDTYKLVRDAFIEAVKEQGTITSVIDGRIAPATKEGTLITVLATSDIHGNIFPWDYNTAKPANRGLAKVSTYVKQVREKYPYVVLVDNGDTIQGTPLSYYYDKIDTKTEYPLAKVMGAMKYDTWTLGNHEFNYGLEVLNRVIKDMRSEGIHVLSANTYKDDGTNYVDAYYIKTFNTPQGPVRVGILGLTTKMIPAWENKENYAGLHFNDLVDEAKKWVPKLREAGADIVVVTMHSGEEKPTDIIPENQVIAVATNVDGIDAIVAGHTHVNIPQHNYKNPSGQTVIVTQPGKWGEYVSQIYFDITKNDQGKWVIADKWSTTIKMDDSIQADPEIINLAQPYHDATLKYIGTKIGVATGDFLGTDQTIKPTAIMDLINKVQKYYAKTDLSIAAPLSSSAKILKGDITIQDIMGVYVYENYLYGIKMTGKQLKAWLEWSARYYKQVSSPNDPITKDPTLNIPDYNLDQLYGASYVIDLTQPAGHRIKNLKVNGKLVKDDDVFTVAINNYRFNGGGGFMQAAGITNPEIVFDSAKAYGDDGQVRNLMIRYIQEHGTISPVVESDWYISTTPVQEEVEVSQGTTQPSQQTEQQTASQPVYNYGIVTASALNVREGAGLGYKVIGVLPAGKVVTLLEEVNGWYKIDYNGKTGYIYSKYVAATPNPSNVVVLKAVKVTAKSGLNVRVNNSINARKIGAVPYGTELKVVGEYNGWYQVLYNGGFGYVYAKYTK